MVLIGLIISIYIGYDKLFKQNWKIDNRKASILYLTSYNVNGIDFFYCWILGELILRSKTDNDNYSIVEKTK